MVPDEDWVDRADEEDIKTIETEEISEEASFLQAIHDLPVYDADGNEIPDEELPWRICEEAPDACDDCRIGTIGITKPITALSCPRNPQAVFRKTCAPLPNAENV